MKFISKLTQISSTIKVAKGITSSTKKNIENLQHDKYLKASVSTHQAPAILPEKFYSSRKADELDFLEKEDESIPSRSVKPTPSDENARIKALLVNHNSIYHNVLDYFYDIDQLNPSPAAIYELAHMLTNLGEELYYNGHYQEAKEYFDIVININPTYRKAHSFLGKIYEYGNGVAIDFIKAREYYELGNNQSGYKRTERKWVESQIQLGKSLNETDREGRTALHRAAQNKALKLYAMLWVLNINPEIKDANQKIASSYLLLDTSFDRVNQLYDKFFYSADDEMFFTSSAAEVIASKIYSISEFNRAEAAAILEELYAKEEIRPLLDLAKLSMLGKDESSTKKLITRDEYNSDDEEEVLEKDKLKIILDPKRITINHMFIDKSNESKNSQGLCFFKNNTLYIAGRREAVQLYGIIVHEIGHYIAQEVFKNETRPYEKWDIINRDKFTAIVNKVKSLNNLPPIFKDIFNPKCYPSPDSYPSELIVRVAQFIVIEKDALLWLRTNIPELLSYYNDIFLAQVKEHEKLLCSKAVGIGWSTSLFKRAPQGNGNSAIPVGPIYANIVPTFKKNI